MKLNLLDIVNKERGRGQRSVVWLKRGQPFLRHLHVLSTAVSWRPLSSFSLWIILFCLTTFVAFMGRWRCTFGTRVLFSRCMFLHSQCTRVTPSLAYKGSGFSQP